ncbi:TPA: hypothetical protein IAA87_05550 [Candidatus Avigastranaerophilus faecigallinarum]|nr:hypothetical protein [Candidatus Avigastranaerophilus faecigallinarum]
MSTTALNNINIPQTPLSINPKEKSTREIVREEIKRAEKIKELEQKHQAGEISDFEYKAQKFLLETPVLFDNTIKKPSVVYSTTA